jgi:hypothetical protein
LTTAPAPLPGQAPADQEWTPPTLDPLPDTTGWTPAALEELALERCKARGHRPRGTRTDPVACKRDLQEVLTGRDPLAEAGPVDLGELFKAIPPPAKGWLVLHRRLLEVLASREEFELEGLQTALGGEWTTESISARIRDLRGFGYPIARRTQTGSRPLYRLGA